MILGALLNPVNSSMIAVALVPIGIVFGAPPAETAWLVGGLYLATAIGRPVAGRLVDTYGPPLFLIDTTLVGLTRVLGYLIRREAQRTGRDSPASIHTLLAVSTQTIAVAGPPLGGMLIGLGGWRAVWRAPASTTSPCSSSGWGCVRRAHAGRPLAGAGPVTRSCTNSGLASTTGDSTKGYRSSLPIDRFTALSA